MKKITCNICQTTTEFFVYKRSPTWKNQYTMYINSCGHYSNYTNFPGCVAPEQRDRFVFELNKKKGKHEGKKGWN